MPILPRALPSDAGRVTVDGPVRTERPARPDQAVADAAELPRASRAVTG